MTQLNDLDFGPSHSWLKTRVGQVLGTAQIEGVKLSPWPRGSTLEEQPVDLYVTPWQGLGGNAANTVASLRLLLRQLEELASNRDMQPLYIGWTSSAAGGAYNAADLHDGWYIVTLAQPDYRRYVVTGGIVTVPVNVTEVATATPSSLALSWTGLGLSSTFTGGTLYSNGPSPLLSFPIGATLPGIGSGATFTRAGGEGAIPVAILQPVSATAPPTINPVRFVRPGTVAGLFTGGVRVFDTMVAGGNAVPTNGTFSNANWVQVYGTRRAFQGDCIVTNGLLLLLFQTGQRGSPQVYVWNTQLAPAQWQHVYDLQYLDSGLNQPTLREVNLEHVDLQDTWVRVIVSSATTNYGQLRVRLQGGQYAASAEFTPLTQANTQSLGLLLNLINAGKIVYDDTGIVDVATSGGTGVAVGSIFGFAAGFGTTANGPLYGLLYQSPPSTAQPSTNGTSNVGFGDTSGPALNATRVYGFFAAPFVTAPNLQAEGEGGVLGTGWSSVADAAASGGNTAKAASGTASTNADLFGTSYVPTAGTYDVWFRVRVTSAAGSAAEMTLGLWDATSAAFVAGGSTTFKANQASTSYVWIRANGAGPCTPTAGHNMQFRAVTAATLGTDWFIDEAVLAPSAVGILANCNFPGDIWAQWAFDLRRRWQVG